MIMSEDKKSWGGKRVGAGRPKIDEHKASKLYTLRLPKELADIVDQQENKSEFIKSCITNSIQPKLEPLGEVYPATSIESFTIPFFDIGIVAGFPTTKSL